MKLRMACPTKRQGSDNWYFRRAIPIDIRHILAALPRQKRPPNWYATHISISLKTADRAAAKAKCPEVAAEVELQMAALRDGPKSLTPKQIAALSGLLYKAFANNLEDQPVLKPEQWRNVAQLNRNARKGVVSPVSIFDDDVDRRAFAMEQRFGRMTDALLTKHHVVTDEDSRWRLIERLSVDLTEASEKLARNAEENYSPDVYAQRFPEWKETEKGAPADKTISGLVAAWHEAALIRGVRKRDAKRMRSTALRFVKALGHDDLRRVTRPDVMRWADQRSKAGIAASTINKTNIAALRAIFGWGVDREWMSANPLQRNVRIEERGRLKVRDEFFSPSEITAILGASLLVAPTKREDPKMTAAKRWVPWLCAYSGARVTEMIQIRRQDVREEAGH